MNYTDVSEPKALEMITFVQMHTNGKASKAYKVLENGKVRIYKPLANAHAKLCSVYERNEVWMEYALHAVMLVIVTMAVISLHRLFYLLAVKYICVKPAKTVLKQKHVDVMAW